METIQSVFKVCTSKASMRLFIYYFYLLWFYNLVCCGGSQSGCNVLEYQNQAKMLFRKLGPQSPPRCSIETGPYLFQWVLRFLCLVILCFSALLHPYVLSCLSESMYFGNLPCHGSKILGLCHLAVVRCSCRLSILGWYIVKWFAIVKFFWNFKIICIFCNTCFCHSSYLIELEICYLVLCERNYSKRLAFSYLEEIAKEFYQQYGKRVCSLMQLYLIVCENIMKIMAPYLNLVVALNRLMKKD